MMSKANHIAGRPAEAARAVLRVVPLVMRTVRAEMRACRTALLSVPQFRTLNFVAHEPDASLSDIAAHMGVALPSMSRLVAGLVDRKLVIRRGYAGDRRRLTLALTRRGRTLLLAAYQFTEASIAARLSGLSGKELAAVVRAMGLLQPIYADRAGPGDQDDHTAYRVTGACRNVLARGRKNIEGSQP